MRQIARSRSGRPRQRTPAPGHFYSLRTNLFLSGIWRRKCWKQTAESLSVPSADGGARHSEENIWQEEKGEFQDKQVQHCAVQDCFPDTTVDCRNVADSFVELPNPGNKNATIVIRKIVATCPQLFANPDEFFRSSVPQFCRFSLARIRASAYTLAPLCTHFYFS